MSDEEGDALTVMVQSGRLEKSSENHSSFGNRKYGDEWEELFQLSENGLSSLQTHVLSMQLQGSRLRSVYWRILLGSLPTSPSLWISILRQQRNSYRLLHQRLTVDPHQANIEDDPLSQNSSSIWNQFFCDKELRALIRQDVVRTFPNEDFFRSESIQSIMVNILFCYAREYPEICYRQGMHEVLAPLLYVMQEDQKSLLRARELSSVSDRAAEILDPAWLEEDVYWLFCKLMSHLAGSYRVRNMTPLSTGHFPKFSVILNSELINVSETELTRRLIHIRDDLLSQFDKELYLHLKNLDIPFQAFGIRWLRLLFGQEFPLQDLLYLWDAIFSEGDDLVNYVVVSMLSAIRDQLLKEDDTDCLMLLMRYPPGVNVRIVVENALQMWKPEKFSLFKEDSYKKEQLETYNAQRQNIVPVKSISGRLKKLNLWSQKKETQPAMQCYISNAPTKVTVTHKHPTRADKMEGIQSIVEGFTLNDPIVTRAEVCHLHNLIFYVHTHLERHHATLEHSVPSNLSPDGRVALDGIKQLCTHLARSLPTRPKPLEVEAAFEAEPAPRMTPSSEIRNTSSELQMNQECPLEEIKVHDGQLLTSYMPLDNPLQALCLHVSEKDASLHISYRRVLGA
ncbi:TBC1 domain family member 5 [Frankliniella fusca]|uniref:TBC1 domain family member 5 n=1 Tax=Frankliniella fusca TaxID=407009 RepID=A0AAE1H0E0_9NEOP|nr:TBC1 domain family member 5 [Frankliniella fusca]